MTIGGVIQFVCIPPAAAADMRMARKIAKGTVGASAVKDWVPSLTTA